MPHVGPPGGGMEQHSPMFHSPQVMYHVRQIHGSSVKAVGPGRVGFDTHHCEVMDYVRYCHGSSVGRVSV